jgi:hypothetical protein
MIDKRFTVAQEVTLWLLQKTRIDIDQEYLIFLMMDRSGRQKKNMAQRLARPFLAESSHQAAVNARNKKKAAIKRPLVSPYRAPGIWLPRGGLEPRT